MRHSRWGLLIAALLLFGCTKADQKPDGVNGPVSEHGSASFLIADADGSGLTGKVNTGEMVVTADGSQRVSSWNIPYEAHFQFKACVEDRASRKEASGHQFQVEIPGKRNLRIDGVSATDPNGCFYWSEVIPYNYIVKRSAWVEIERDIIGTGVHTGRQRIKFGINPWLLRGSREEGKAVCFLRENCLPKNSGKLVPATHADQALSGELLGEADLHVEEVKVQTLRREEGSFGTYFRMNVSMEPRIALTDSSGIEHFRSIENGDFDVIAHLVLAQAGPELKDHLILTSHSQSVVQDQQLKRTETATLGRVIDGKLVAHINAWSTVKMPQGNLQVVLKLIPRGVRGLKSYEGIFDVGNQRSLSSDVTGQLSKECREGNPRSLTGSCEIASYLKSAANFKEVYQKQLDPEARKATREACRKLSATEQSKRKECVDHEKDILENSPYLFDRMNLRFVQVDDYETTMERWVDYTASTCVTDSFTGERVVGLKFKIVHEDPITKQRREEYKSTLEDGCLNWDSKIYHKYYQPEQYIRNVVSIEKGTGFKRELSFYINPWDDKFTFGFDERQFGEEFWEKQAKRNKIRSRFFLADFGYHTVRFQYNIDSLMNLEVRKTVLMELEPRVLRYSGIINARKMTEPLRDGIWLMKVALQKNYLDPAQMGVSIEALKDREGGAEGQAVIKLANETEQQREKTSLNRLRKLGINAPAREFISTQTALVRSTDGVIIQPVELKMHDLRMMRVRSNFLIQLQAVDETKLQVHNGLDRNFRNVIDGIMQDRKKKEEERRQRRDQNQGQVDDKTLVALEEKAARERLDIRKKLTRRIFDYISGLRGSISSVQTSLQPFEMTEEERQYVNDFLGGSLENLGLSSIDEALKTNDFTNIRLPSCTDIDCNLFAAAEHKDGEYDMGLDRRTFVGPVIFLANGYKDSVRATDNLDEAMCGQKVQIDDPFEAELRAKEKELFATTDQHISKERVNTIYRFSEYFGSLRHLCFAQVDTMIDKEKISRVLYEQNGPAMASVYNFVANFNMNFLSLADEKPKSVELSPETLQRCKGDLKTCMQETEEFRLPLSDAIQSINDSREWVKAPLLKWFYTDNIKQTDWSPDDLRDVLFPEDEEAALAVAPNAMNKAQKFAGCTILIKSLETEFKAKNKPLTDYRRRNLMFHCMQGIPNPVVFDRKLRVFETGQDGDSYVFLGGFQVNLNVGQSFSVSRSQSSSWSWGLEAFDMIGAGTSMKMLPNALGALTKPLSLKAGQSTSLGSSDGTSVSDSTYLVAQIAKFRVRLDKFERCVALHFSREYRDFVNDDEVNKARGVFVCEGELNRQPKYIDEKYFYFTQHFTEGDMLDQADLYNHPWLLALRGQRDFSTFVNTMRTQEPAGFLDFAKETVVGRKQRPDEWPLDQMRNTYKEITPTFPGFYTQLGEMEKGPDFPLQERLRKTDDDLNGEVINNPQFQKERSQMRVRDSD